MYAIEEDDENAVKDAVEADDENAVEEVFGLGGGSLQWCKGVKELTCEDMYCSWYPHSDGQQNCGFKGLHKSYSKYIFMQ